MLSIIHSFCYFFFSGQTDFVSDLCVALPHRSEWPMGAENNWCRLPLPSFCFSGQSEKQDGLTGIWFAETFSTSHLQYRIQRNLTGSKISTSSTKVVFFGWIGKQLRWPSLLLIGGDIFDFSSEMAVRNNQFNETWQESISQHPLTS